MVSRWLAVKFEQIFLPCREFEANGLPPRPAMKEKVEAAASELEAAASAKKSAAEEVCAANVYLIYTSHQCTKKRADQPQA